MAYIRETWGPPSSKSPSLGYEKEVQAAALRYRVDASLIKAVIQTESRFRSLHVDSYGAIGLMQITPNIAQSISTKKDWFRANTNIMIGTHYLKKQLQRYRSPSRALAAYHYSMRGLTPPKNALRSIYVRRTNRAFRRFRRDPGHQIRRASRYKKTPRRSRLKQVIQTLKTYF